MSLPCDDQVPGLGLRLPASREKLTLPPRSYDPVVFDPDDLTATYQFDIRPIIRDMLARIHDAEEGVREQVMVEWLRAHGWRVERVEPEVEG